MGPRLCAVSRRSGRAGGGPRVQPDPFQHATRYLAFRISGRLQQRFEGGSGPGQSALLHNPDGEGRVRAGFGGGLPEGPPGRSEHRRDAGDGGALAPSERAEPADKEAPACPCVVVGGPHSL